MIILNIWENRKWHPNHQPEDPIFNKQTNRRVCRVDAARAVARHGHSGAAHGAQHLRGGNRDDDLAGRNPEMGFIKMKHMKIMGKS